MNTSHLSNPCYLQKLILSVLISVLITSGTSADTIFIPKGAVWKYLDDGSDQDTTWHNKNFNDSSWASGPAQFGYGEGYEASVVSYGPDAGNKYITTYFRHTFNFNDIASLDSLFINLLRDDGAIIYINGVEIIRSNMPAGTITYTTLASASVGGADETTYFNYVIPKSVLDSGINVVAVEVHQNSPSSSDLSFDIEFGDVKALSFNSNLPIIKINTSGQEIPDEPKIVAEMGIIYNGVGVRNYIVDSCNDYNGRISIERKGSSSIYWGYKSYALETQDSLGDNLNVSLLGMPAENDWILYDNTNYDYTCINNVLVYKLSNDMGRYAARTYYCELFLNDQYQGIYILMEKIKRDKNRVDIAKLDTYTDTVDDGLTGGYIFKIDKILPCTNCYYWSSPVTPQYPMYEDSTSIWGLVYPDYDVLQTFQMNYIKNYVDSFELALAGHDYNES